MRRSLAAAVAILTLTSIAVPAYAEEGEAASTGLVLINELANGGPNSDADTFFELRNWDDHAIDLTGWQVFRCSAQGLRANVSRTEGDLTGVVLQPGEILTVSRIGMAGDLHTTSPYDLTGFGLLLEAPDDSVADRVGVYPNEPWPTASECTGPANLPNSLNYARGESWQRVGTGSLDFIAAPATLGAQNATAGISRAASTVIINEFAASGPASTDDEFLELRNVGTASVDIGGWQLSRCTATGRLRASTHQLTIPSGTRLAAGGYYVIGGPGFTGSADATYGTELADTTSGMYLATGDGLLVDRIAVSAYADSACQDGDDKLPAILDYVAGESYSQGTKGFVIARRTPGTLNASTETSVFRQQFSYGEADIAISELGTDPGDGPGSVQHNYVELGNYGDEAVDISGWTIRRCEATGIRSRELQLTVADGTTLAPGDTYLAARAGTAVNADGSYDTTLNFLGTGIWLADDRGVRVDSVGVYAMNEMDKSHLTISPCTKGMPLTTYQPDRTLGETFQRTQFSGVDAEDFIVAVATPGVLDDHEWVDPTARVYGEVPAFAPVVEAVETLPATASGATVLEAWSGVSAAPLTVKVGASETISTGTIGDDAWGYPYERLVLDASTLVAGSRVFWEGATTGRNELQLSVWSPATGSWRRLDAATGSSIQLSGALEQNELDNGRVTLLVQNGPRTQATLTNTVDGQLEDPASYDFAISHITDTQYLTESYPEVYAQLVSWIADNAASREIAFATHTGDLVQNWVDPDQGEDRARVEFERASSIQQILEQAGVPNSTLPGNHDNKRGVDASLYLEYFGPDRNPDATTLTPTDSTSSYQTFERDGAKFLMLSLGYAYGDEEIAWASSVVTSHPDHNVVISTHEHVTPLTLIEEAHRSVNSRWLSKAQDLWDTVIAPNRNVVVVLSGHFHGIGKIVTENAGGIEGHNVVELLADYQEFRTHDGERATGFQRLLQIDLASQTIAVDTFSATLGASASFDYDYPQFVPDTGLASSPSNARPWNIVALGTQDRYTETDDEFTATAGFQYAKLVATSAVSTAPPLPAAVDTTTTAGSSRDYLDLFGTVQI